MTCMPPLVTKSPAAHIVTATKQLVDALLSMNTRNRRPKESHISRLATDCEDGNFLLTASGIGVSSTGVLLDGQNRLMAIREAGYPPVQFVLVTGLEDESQRVVDRHAKRSLSDALTIYMNITVSSHMVALANALADFGATRGISVPFTYRDRGAKGTITDSKLGDFMSEHGDLTARIVSTTKGAKAPVMAAIWVYAYHHEDGAMDFARQVATGAGISEDSPAYRLRAAIFRMRSSNGAAGRMELFKLAVTACIHHHHEREVKLLRAADSWEGSRWKWRIKGGSIFDDQARIQA
jgi:hypothetical protein